MPGGRRARGANFARYLRVLPGPVGAIRHPAFHERRFADRVDAHDERAS